MPLPSKKITLVGTAFLAALLIYLNKTSDAPQYELAATPPIEKKNNTAAIDISRTAEKAAKAPQPEKRIIASQQEVSATIFDSDYADQIAIDAEIDAERTSQPSEPEAQDAHWAFEKENYYINLFSEEESLSGFVLNEAKCEDFQCKLSFLLDDEQQKDDITNKLMERLISQSEDISVSFGLNTPNHEAILHIKNEKPN